MYAFLPFLFHFMNGVGHTRLHSSKTLALFWMLLLSSYVLINFYCVLIFVYSCTIFIIK